LDESVSAFDGLLGEPFPDLIFDAAYGHVGAGSNVIRQAPIATPGKALAIRDRITWRPSVLEICSIGASAR
jgi:hypothetical protein